MHGSGPTFLTSSNPDQVKRNVLAGFKDALLLPVTIVPRTVTYGVNATVSGLSMLNPQKWAAGSKTPAAPTKIEEKDGAIIFTAPTEEKIDEKMETLQIPQTAKTPSSTRAATPVPDTGSFDRLQLLVSLDTALELIQADRDALKRAETFAKYPGKCGHRVRETIEEIFILMLKAAGDRHIAPGFRL